ncbi:DEAD/DEAH box helicase family protein [Terrisporobacter glycolicus]|uniref:DEAD/DEAH box helicase family protein n=1 Tax=Terrisporobacter glycolicus TaxID=36841 RepID=UPI0034640FCB
MKQYVSNYINIDNIDQSRVNMIISGTGSGKSWWCINEAISQFNVRPCEILFVTSRRITQDQQGKNYENAIVLTPNQADDYANCFNDNRLGIGTVKERRLMHRNHIHIINYNEYTKYYMGYFEIRANTKIIVFDEYHAMYSDCNYNGSMKETLNDIPELIKEGKIVIGMTATDDDIPERHKEKLNYLLYKPMFPYRVTKQFNIVKFKRYLPSIINNLEGKTLWMTFSAKDALKYANQYPNARAVISKQSEFRTEEIDEQMEQLEDYIKKYKTLPDDVDILIGTSCIREGFEFREDDEVQTNIKNVIIHSSDPVTIKQFIGRYRHNVENLHVVYEPHLNLKKVNDSMTRMQRKHHKEFKQMLWGKDTHWLYYFICIVADKSKRESEGSLLRFTEDEQIEQLFIEYIYEQWSNKLIYTKEHKKEIEDKAYGLGIRRSGVKKAKFATLIELLKANEVEFAMEGENVVINNELVQKYLHDEDFTTREIRPYVIAI